MLFSHSPQLLDQFPQLSVATLSITGVTADPDIADTTPPFLESARARLDRRTVYLPRARRLLSSRPSVWIKGAWHVVKPGKVVGLTNAR